MTTLTSKGGWVYQDAYSPGKRHYHPDASITETVSEPNSHGWVAIRQVMASPSVCTIDNQTVFTSKAYLDKNGSFKYRWGHASVVENPNLMQRNLCAYCLKIFFRDYRPDLADAFNALKKPTLKAEMKGLT